MTGAEAKALVKAVEGYGVHRQPLQRPEVEALPPGVTTVSTDPKPLPWYWDKKIERPLFKTFGKASIPEKRQIIARVVAWKIRMENELHIAETPLHVREQ